MDQAIAIVLDIVILLCMADNTVMWPSTIQNLVLNTSFITMMFTRAIGNIILTTKVCLHSGCESFALRWQEVFGDIRFNSNLTFLKVNSILIIVYSTSNKTFANDGLPMGDFVITVEVLEVKSAVVSTFVLQLIMLSYISDWIAQWHIISRTPWREHMFQHNSLPTFVISKSSFSCYFKFPSDLNTCDFFSESHTR